MLIVARRCCVLLVVDVCRCALLPAAVWQEETSVGGPSWGLSRVRWVCCAVQVSCGPRQDHRGPLGDSFAGFLERHGRVGLSWIVLELHTFLKRVEGELSMTQIASRTGDYTLGEMEMERRILELEKEIAFLQSKL